MSERHINNIHEQTIFRNNDDAPYFIMANSAAQDTALSYEALGLLTYLLSKPKDWKVMIPDLTKRCGSEKVYRMINELLANGYLERRQDRSEASGKFGGAQYLVYGTARTPETPLPENPHTVKPDTGEPHAANPTLQSNEVNKGKKEERKDARAGAPASPPVPKPPTPPDKPGKPPKLTRAEKRRQAIDDYHHDHADDLDTLRRALGQDTAFIRWDNMTLVEREAFIEAHRQLAEVGVSPDEYAPLATYSAPRRKWKEEPMQPRELLEYLTDWRMAGVSQQRAEQKIVRTEPGKLQLPDAESYIHFDQAGGGG